MSILCNSIAQYLFFQTRNGVFEVSHVLEGVTSSLVLLKSGSVQFRVDFPEP